MIKRTLCFSNPAVLSMRNAQLVVKLLDKDNPQEHTIPIEDIGFVVLDHQQITITHGALSALVDNEVAVVTCDQHHMPNGLTMPLEGHSKQSEHFRQQIDASLPLKKQLWQQTIMQKIHNQAAVLRELRGVEVGCMVEWSKNVKSDDADNHEARAAAYYWQNMFEDCWTRSRFGNWPNPLLNYGYAILRAVVARALVCSGLLPTFGIHHHNVYNAYCLADDIMEPYRPYVDRLVYGMLKQWPDGDTITKEMKQSLLTIPVLDVVINKRRSPLMLAVAQTAASLSACYAGTKRKIAYPVISFDD